MPRLPIDYSKCVIYKIVCNDLTITELYVGHTTDFTRRNARHKYTCHNEKAKNYNLIIYQIIRQNGGYSNWTMVQIEKYPCFTSQEARARERYFYELLNSTMNSIRPYITETEKIEFKQAIDKQYREANKTKIADYTKAYKEANKEKIANNTKAYYEANKEDIKLCREANKEKIAEYKKAYFKANKKEIYDKRKLYCEANKEKIADYMKAYYQVNKK